MEKVNVYDFDKTILPYDSTEAFFRHCLRRYPRVLFPALGALPWAAGRFALLLLLLGGPVLRRPFTAFWPSSRT